MIPVHGQEPLEARFLHCGGLASHFRSDRMATYEARVPNTAPSGASRAHYRRIQTH